MLLFRLPGQEHVNIMGIADIIGITLTAITTVAFGTMFLMVLSRAIKEKKP